MIIIANRSYGILIEATKEFQIDKTWRW